MNKKKSQSFSLIEVLVFTSILSLFFVVAAAVATASLRNMKINEHKILATRYAEELLEWLRGEKETDWNTFISRSNNTTYCFSISPITSWPSQGSCSGYNGLNPAIYKRELTLTTVGGGIQVNVSIVVSWQELGNTYSVPINTVFTVWEY
ncbi:MAG: hypothetical protein ACK4FL_00525 [Microgenomates group bacterium]